MASLVSAVTTAALTLSSVASNHGFLNSSGSVTALPATITGPPERHFNTTFIYSQLNYTGPTTPIKEFHSFLSSSVNQVSEIALTTECASSCWASFSSSVDAWSTESFGSYNYSTLFSFGSGGATEEAYYNVPSMTQGENCYCSGCSIAGNSAKILVWPTPAPDPAVTSFVSNGNTFISPSMYIDMHMGMWVRDKCGLRTTISSTMFSYESVPLYEIMWKDNYHLESIAVPYSLNALQTAYTREASAYVNGTLYTRQCYVYGSSDCPPQIQFPTAILEKYGWGDCSISGANSGFYDPPQYLTPQNGLAEKTSTPPKTTGASTITSESPAPASTASQMPPLTSFKATSTSEVPSRFSQQSRPLEPPSSARLPRSKADPSNEHTEGSQPLQSSSAGKPTEQDQETIFVSPLASSAPSASDHLLSPAPDPGSHRPPAPSITINNQVFPLDPTSQQASSSINALDSSSDSALVSSPIPSSGNAPQPLTSVNTLANAIASAFGLPAPAPVDPQQTPQTSSTAPAKFGPTSPEDSQSAAHGFPGNAVSTGDPSTPISPGSSNPKPLPVTIDGSIFSAGAPAATVAGVPISVGQTAIVVGTKTIPLLLAAVSGTEGEGTASVGAATGISAEIGPGNGGSSGGKSGLGGEATGVGTVPGSAAATAVIGIDGGGRGSRGNAAAAQSAVEADIASAVEAQATEIAPGKSGGDGNVSNPGETNNATVNESTNSGSGRGSSGGSGNKGGKSTSGGAAVGNKASATTGSNKNDEANGEESGSPAATSMGSKATESVKVANAAEHVFSRWKAVHALMGALWVGLGLYIM